MLLQMNPHSASCPQSTSKGASLSTWQSNKLRWPDFFSIHPVSCWSRVVYIISPCCCSKGHIADRYRGIHQGVLQATKKGLADFYLFIFFGGVLLKSLQCIHSHYSSEYLHNLSYSLSRLRVAALYIHEWSCESTEAQQALLTSQSTP